MSNSLKNSSLYFRLLQRCCNVGIMILCVVAPDKCSAQINVSGDVSPGYDNSDPWDAGSRLTIGNLSSGSLEILNNSRVFNSNGFLGFDTGGQGHVTVDGVNAEWNNSFAAYIGYRGTGQLDIMNGGRVVSRFTYIGSTVGATGTVTLDSGATLISQSDFRVGVNGTGELNIGNASQVDASATTWVGTPSSSVNFSGGVLNTRAIAYAPNQLTGIGTINTRGILSDFALTFDSTSMLQQQIQVGSVDINLDMSATSGNGILGVGYHGVGTLEISNGVTVESGQGFLGYRAGASGVATVDGANSTWDASSISVGFNGEGTLNILNGGTVANNNATIGNGTATVDSASFWNVMFHLEVEDEGTLNLDGEVNAGRVTLNGGGKMQFNGGTLNTNEVRANFRDLPGTGTINTRTLVTDTNLIFDASHGLQQQFLLTDEPNQNIELNMDASTPGLNGALGAGFSQTGSLTIADGISIQSTRGYFGSEINSSGTGLVTGEGSNWTITNFLFVGLLGTGNLTIDNGASLNTSGTSIGGTQGKLTISNNSSWNSTGSVWVGNFDSTGILEINSGGEATISNNSLDIARGSVGSQGTVTVHGANSTLSVLGGSIYVGGSNGFAGGTGTLNVMDGAHVSTDGTLKVWDEGTVNLSGGTLDATTLDLSAPTATDDFNMTGGRLVVDMIVGDFQQDGGTLAPGDSPGLTEIQGNYEMNAGIIEFEIGGLTRETGFDALDITGTATLNGTMELTLINGFIGSLGDAFMLIDAAGGYSGTPMFDFSAASLVSGLAWDTSSFSTNGTISITTAVPEPSSCLIVGFACCCLSIRRRRRA